MESINYLKTLSHVIRHSIVRMVIIHTILKNWSIKQMYINNTFLNSNLEEEVFL